MAGTTIGKLNVVLSADATEFEKGITAAERRMVAFASKWSNPISHASRIGGMLAGIGAGPLGVVGGAASSVMRLFDPAGSSLLNPEKLSEAMQNVEDRTVSLAKTARRLDFDPQFLRGIRGLAGDDADAAEAGITKIIRLAGQAKTGNKEAAEKFDKWGVDIGGKNTEQILLGVANRYASLRDPLDQAAMGADLAKKGFEGLHGVLAGGAGGIEAYVKKVKDLGIANKETVAHARALKMAEKEFKLERESAEEKAFGKYGAYIKEGQHNMATKTGLDWAFGGLSQVITGHAKQALDTLGIDFLPDLKPEYLDKLKKYEKWLETTEGKTHLAVLAAADLTKAFDRQADAVHNITDLRELMDEKGISDKNVRAGVEEKFWAAQNRHGNDALKEFNKHLEERVGTHDMTDLERMARRLRLDATDAKAKEENQGLLKENTRQDLVDQTRTPWERLVEDKKRLKGWLEEGTIDQDLYNRGLVNAMKKAGAKETEQGPYRLASSALKGSAEDAHIMNQQWAEQQYGNKTVGQKAEEMTRSLQAIKIDSAMQTQLLRKIDENKIVVGLFPED